MNATLHAIDIENIALGQGRPDTGQLVRMASAYRRLVGIDPKDRVIVGCSPFIELSAQYAFPEARVVTRHGPDGADLALLEVLEGEIHNEWAAVWIGSGDWRFADIARRFGSTNARVAAVSRPACISKTLRVAVQNRVKFICGLRSEEPA